MTKKEIQKQVQDLMIVAKNATFNISSVFTLDIDESVGVVNFEDMDKDFSPAGYDERDRVIGIGIDMENDNLMVLTTDCERNDNMLEPDDAPMSAADWRKIRDIVHGRLKRDQVFHIYSDPLKS